MPHEIDSVMLYVHPPLAIIGYALITAVTVFLVLEVSREKETRGTKRLLYTAWIFNLLGIITGSIWAYSAWGSFWSWDPKETVTLVMFAALVFSVLCYEAPMVESGSIRWGTARKIHEWRSGPAGRRKLALAFIGVSLLMMCLNIGITLGNLGMHSYGFF